MIKNTKDSFGLIARLFHWIIFALFLIMFISGYVMVNLSDSDFKFTIFDLHKSSGLLIFSLITLRLIWRYINIQPGLSAFLPAWQRSAAKWNIIILYFLMFAMPISGFLTSTSGGYAVPFYGLFLIPPFGHDNAISELFAGFHKYFSFILIAAISLHVLGALYHHFYLRDSVLRRMLHSTESSHS